VVELANDSPELEINLDLTTLQINILHRLGLWLGFCSYEICVTILFQFFNRFKERENKQTSPKIYPLIPNTDTDPRLNHPFLPFI